MRLLAPLVAAGLFACASPTTPVEPDLTMGDARDLTTGRDLSPAPDLMSPCTLGTVDNCGACGHVCPPGTDDDGTQRTCSGPTSFDTCSVVCKGEYYDVNGVADDGCEALDDPLQSNPAIAVAVTLPNVDDPTFMSNPRNIVHALPSDARTHTSAPTMRPLGVADWYKIEAQGAGAAGTGMLACLGITGLPADNRFEVCISALNMQTFDATSCATAFGGPPEMGNGAVCVTPPGATDAGMYYYVRVQKLAGAHSTNSYALFLKH